MSYETDVLSHVKALRAFAMKLSHNHTVSDDLVQDTMFKAFSKKAQYKEGTNLKAWLYTILRNEFLNTVRKNRFVSDPDDVFSSHITVNPEQEIIIQWKEFNAIFSDMEEDKKRGLQLVLIDGYSYEEAAEMEKVAIGTMKSRVSRARAYVKERMELLDVDAISTGVMITNDNIRYNYR